MQGSVLPVGRGEVERRLVDDAPWDPATSEPGDVWAALPKQGSARRFGLDAWCDPLLLQSAAQRCAHMIRATSSEMGCYKRQLSWSSAHDVMQTRLSVSGVCRY